MGCANAVRETNSREKSAMVVPIHRVLRLVRGIAGPQIRVSGTGDVVECPAGQIGIEDMEMRVRLEREV